MCDYRDIQKSIRISEDVYNFINNADGDNFNDRLNNLLIFFRSEYDNKLKDIELLQNRYDDLKADYDDLSDAMFKLQDIDTLYLQFRQSVIKAVKFCDNVVRGDS